MRAAKRTADGLDAELIALYVETERHATLSEAEHGRLAETMRLADQLGAEVVTVPGRSVVEEILAFARSRNATRVVVGKSQRSRWFELRHGSVVDSARAQRLGPRRRGGAVRDEAQAPPGPTDWLLNVPRTPGPYLEGALTTAVATARRQVLIDASHPAQHFARSSWCRCWSRRRGTGWCPSLWVSALCVLAFNFFFLPPLYQFTIADPANVVALFFFMFVAVAASALAARTRSQTEAARREARTPPSSTPSAARSPASSTSTTCCGSWSPISPGCSTPRS